MVLRDEDVMRQAHEMALLLRGQQMMVSPQTQRFFTQHPQVKGNQHPLGRREGRLVEIKPGEQPIVMEMSNLGDVQFHC